MATDIALQMHQKIDWEWGGETSPLVYMNFYRMCLFVVLGDTRYGVWVATEFVPEETLWEGK